MSSSDSGSDSSVWETEMFIAVSKKQGKGKNISEEDRIKQIKDCLDQGVNIDTQYKNGDTVLHIAVNKGYQQVVKFLRQKGARYDIPNRRSCTAIKLAEELNNLTIVSILEDTDQRCIRTDPKIKFCSVKDGQKPSTSRDGISTSSDSLVPVAQSLKRKPVNIDNIEYDKTAKEQRLESMEVSINVLQARRFEGNPETVVRSSRYDHKESYAASGLKQSLHGAVYQLKLLMLVVNRVWKKGFAFCLSTEMNAAEKFDDLVLEYEDSSGNEVHKFLQAKHKEDDTKIIATRHLLDVKDGEFSLLKYFISWRKIKSSSTFGQSGTKNFILCTNIALDIEELESSGINVSEMEEADDFLKVTNRTLQPPRYKLLVENPSELWNILKSASDVHRLASVLAKRVHDSKEIDLKTGIFRCYHAALAKEVIDTRRKKFFHGFIKSINLSPNAENFREVFLFHTKQLWSRGTVEKDIWEELEKRVLKLSASFGKRFELTTEPNLTSVDGFTRRFVQLLKIAMSNDNVVKIERQKNATDFSAERIFSDDLDKLAGHVLITESGKVKFRSQFLDDDVQLAGNIGDFKTALKSGLGSKFEELDALEFKINGFKTCTEEELSSRTELPDDNIDDVEIADFLDEFVLAVDQPNEIELGEMIKSEIGAYSQFNLLNADFIGDSFQNVVLDWFKKTGKYSVFLKNKDAKGFFSKIESELSSLITIGLNLPYPSEIRKFGVRFEHQNNEVKSFLDFSNSSRSPILILISTKQTLLSAIRVYQTLEGIEKYEKKDSFIFIHLEKALLPEIKSQVLRAFKSPRSHDLVVVDCGTISKIHDTYRFLYQLSDIIENNSSKRMILIIKGNDDSVVRFEIGYKSCQEEDEDVSIDRLHKLSRVKLLKKMIVKFQGQDERTSIGRVLGITDFEEKSTRNLGRIIGPSTLIQLIKDEEVKIGSAVKGLGDIEDYYIARTILRRVVIKAKILEVQQATDLFAVSGIGREDLEELVAHTRIDQCMFLESYREKEQFILLYDRYSSKNIHWLAFESGKFIWKQSFGSIAYLVAFEDESRRDEEIDGLGATRLTESELVAHEEELRIVILSDMAGMGKSTVLTHLGGMMSRNKSTMLVIRVDLTQHTTALAMQQKNRSFDCNNIEGAVDFLIESLLSLESEFETQTFRTIIKGRGEAALLFDGFDEISPSYEETVVELLQALAKCSIKRLFVTTRPHTKKSLEKKLGIFSHMMQPFSAADQMDFLTKFWRKDLTVTSIDETDEKQEELLVKHAEVVTKILAKAISPQMKEFTGVPLQTRLVAEVFPYGGEERLSELVDVIDLYEKFVDKKYRIYIKEKKLAEETNLGVIEDDRITRKKFSLTHQKLALDSLFDETIVNMLLNSQPEVDGLFKLFQDKNSGEERTGIITQVIDKTPEFIHRTFAEFFAAIFLTNTLRDFSRNQETRKFFISKLFLDPQYKTIRAFVNCLLSRESDTTDNERWEFDLRDNRDEHGNTLYHIAAEERNVGIVRFFLNRLNVDRNDINLQDEEGRTPLHIAVTIEHCFELVNCLVEGGADIESADHLSCTPLHEASKLGNLEVVEYLLNKGVTVNSLDAVGWTPLHRAASDTGNLDVVKYLLDKSSRTDHREQEGGKLLHKAAMNWKNSESLKYIPKEGTPFHESAEYRNLLAINYLAEQGVDLSVLMKKEENSLHSAIPLKNFEVVKCLVENGADINLQGTSDGTTPLHQAMMGDNLEVVKYLHKKGGNINFHCKTGWTPLHLAAEHCSMDIIEYLVNEGVEINPKDKDGWTPLHKAATVLSNFRVVKYLHEKGADIHCKTNDGYTPLHSATEQGNFELVKYLVDEGVELEPRNKYGWKPLHLASQFSHIELVKYFIDKGADVHCQDEEGLTPIHKAASRIGNLEVLEYLIGKGAEIDCRDKNGRTPLNEAVFNEDNLEVVKYLVGKGCDIHSKTKKGATPLFVAVFYGSFDAVEYLLENGADINCQNVGGQTPLHAAVHKGKWDVVKFLIDKGADLGIENQFGHTPQVMGILKYGHSDEVRKAFDSRYDGKSSNDDDDNTVLQILRDNYREIGPQVRLSFFR